MKVLPILFLLIFIHSHASEKMNGRIFDGSQAQINEFPWMVSIRVALPDQLIHLCGGAIVSDIFVVTAASCFPPAGLPFPILFSIKAGIYNILNETESIGQLRSVSQIILHPSYMPNKFLSNIALVRVSQPFSFTTLSVSPISLSNLTSLENIDLITIGWGLTSNQSNSSTAAGYLQQRTVRENVQCNLTDPYSQLCATGKKYLNSNFCLNEFFY
jgi:secreted trypsin-like serine protease